MEGRARGDHRAPAVNVIARRHRAGTLLVSVFGVTFAYFFYRMPPPEFFLTSQDHGVQIVAGLAMLAGRLPGVDYLTPFGPLVAASSAAGLWLGQHGVLPLLAGEVVICAAGFALTIALLAGFVSRWTRPWLGVASAVALVLLFPRYYKWYYWLWPAVVLLMFERHL